MVSILRSIASSGTISLLNLNSPNLDISSKLFFQSSSKSSGTWSSQSSFRLENMLRSSFSPPTIGAHFPVGSKISATLPAQSTLVKLLGISEDINLRDLLPLDFLPKVISPKFKPNSSNLEYHFMPATLMVLSGCLRCSGGS